MVSVVTRDVLIASGFELSAEPHSVVLNEGAASRLSGPNGYSLDFAHRYLILAPTSSQPLYRVSSREYTYEVHDRDDHLVVGWHWHPRGRSPATWPHLHVPRDCAHSLGRTHPPTDRVSIEAVVAFLIKELGVRPLRDDWERELDHTRQRFEQHRSWP